MAAKRNPTAKGHAGLIGRLSTTVAGTIGGDPIQAASTRLFDILNEHNSSPRYLPRTITNGVDVAPKMICTDGSVGVSLSDPASMLKCWISDSMEDGLPKNRPLLAQLANIKSTLLANGAREQFGALCYRMNDVTRALEVLLITTRESRRWAIPKGWPMEGRSGQQVAEQEAREEAGVCGKVSKKAFGYFTYLKCLSDGEKVPCVVQVHLLKFEKSLDHYREQGQRELLWCSCFEAAVKVDEPELKGLFRLLHERKTKLR